MTEQDNPEYEAWVESLPDGEEDFTKQEEKPSYFQGIKNWYYHKWLPYWFMLKLSFSRSDKVLEMFLQGVPEDKKEKTKKSNKRTFNENPESKEESPPVEHTLS